MSISADRIIQKDTLINDIDFLSGHVILIDKPLHWTSFDVVNKIRFKIKHELGIKKIKVGHAGTLDPLATGLLLICTGKLTKQIDTLQAIDKVYSGTIILGASTQTFDSEIEPDNFFPTDHITPDVLETARMSFIGQIDQMPPIYSAIKVKGKKAYDLARRGIDVVLKPKSVCINYFEFTALDLPKISFKVGCSKGTYIRSLANDFGIACQSGGYLGSLRRDSIGDYNAHQSLTVDEAVDFIERSIEVKSVDNQL